MQFTDGFYFWHVVFEGGGELFALANAQLTVHTALAQ